jgi:hypothetical protein
MIRCGDVDDGKKQIHGCTRPNFGITSQGVYFTLVTPQHAGVSGRHLSILREPYSMTIL